MINIYRKDHFSSLFDLIHIIITVPVANADNALQTRVGMLIQSEYILKTCSSTLVFEEVVGIELLSLA